MRLWLMRALFAITFTSVTLLLRPFEFSFHQALLAGLLLSAAAILFEVRVRDTPVRKLVGAALGSIFGILGASLISLVIDNLTFVSQKNRKLPPSARVGRHDLCRIDCWSDQRQRIQLPR